MLRPHDPTDSPVAAKLIAGWRPGGGSTSDISYVRDVSAILAAFFNKFGPETVARGMGGVIYVTGLSPSDRSCLTLAETRQATALTADPGWPTLNLNIRIEIACCRTGGGLTPPAPANRECACHTRSATFRRGEPECLLTSCANSAIVRSGSRGMQFKTL